MYRLPGFPPSNGTVRQVSVPSSARALSTLSHNCYADAFLLDTGPTHDRTGEQWARAILEGAPAPTRAAAISAWSALGLRLGSTRSDQLVLGWELRRSAADFALVAASSPVGLGRGSLQAPSGDASLRDVRGVEESRSARTLGRGRARASAGGALPSRPGRRPSAGPSPKPARRVTRNQDAAGNRAAHSSSSTCAALIA